MPTLEEIKEQILSLDGASKLLGRREIKELPKILWEDENVEKIVQGRLSGNLGILIATNKRLVFVDKKIIGLRVEDFPYDKITSLKYETKMLYGIITVYASGNRSEIKNIMPKNNAKEFAEYVRARTIGTSTHQAHKAEIKVPNDGEVLDKLERLAKLKATGVITAKEFDTQKKKLLS